MITAIRQDVDNPGVRAGEALQELLYGPAHPYGRPAKGTVESVERIRRDDLVAFHAARFPPSALSWRSSATSTPSRALSVRR